MNFGAHKAEQTSEREQEQTAPKSSTVDLNQISVDAVRELALPLLKAFQPVCHSPLF
jgi:hypothetical protein